MGPLENIVKARAKEVKKAALAAVKKAARREVETHRRRAARGQDVAGAAFKPLSRRYARRVGRRRFKATSFTRLLRIRQTRAGYSITMRARRARGGQSYRRIGAWHNTGTRRGLPRRRWFGLSARSRRRHVADVRRATGRALRLRPRRLTINLSV